MTSHLSESVRVRLGQKYLESGTDGKPTLVRLEVMQVDPLLVRTETWQGSRGHEPRPYDKEALLALPLVYDPDLNAAEVKEVMVGRTIVGAEIHEDDSDWPQGDGDLTLTLDNGRVVSLRSIGYDSWSMCTSIEPPLKEHE